MNVELLSSFVPEFREIFVRRYEILEYLNRTGTITEEELAEKLNISKETINYEITKLKDIGLIEVNSSMISVNKKARVNLKRFNDTYRDLNNLKELGAKVTSLLGIEEVIVVKGDYSKGDYAFYNLAAATARLINLSICEGDLMGITGGKTLRSIADKLSESKRDLGITVIPARGSLGSVVEYQSNSIAAIIADKLHCEYKLFPVPDTVSDEAMNMLLENEEVSETYQMLKHLDLLIFGVGRADEMLERKGIDKEKTKEILDQGAVSEVIGHYFDKEGKEIYVAPSSGISLQDFLKIPIVIGVCGGVEKSEAIVSISNLRKDMVLVIDESAANCILNTRR